MTSHTFVFKALTFEEDTSSLLGRSTDEPFTQAIFSQNIFEDSFDLKSNGEDSTPTITANKSIESTEKSSKDAEKCVNVDGANSEVDDSVDGKSG